MIVGVLEPYVPVSLELYVAVAPLITPLNAGQLCAVPLLVLLPLYVKWFVGIVGSDIVPLFDLNVNVALLAL